MAGIGFALRRLGEQENLISRSMAAGHAVLVSFGPWIVIMAGLAVMTTSATMLVGSEETRIFSVLVIYSFALSLMITAPIGLEATLKASGLIYGRQFADVQAVYVGTLGVSIVAAFALGSATLFGLLKLPFGLGIAALLCLLQVSLLWIAMSFVAAIRQYAAVTTAFALGLTCSVTLGLAAANMGHGAAGMLLGFGAGLSVAFCILNFLILRTFPGRLPEFTKVLSRLRSARLQSSYFAIAGLLGAMAVWADKLIVWNSGEARILGEVLRYAPRYDSAIFMAYLSMVPVMSVLVVWLETSFFESYRRYRDIVQSGGTLRQIELQRRILAQDTTDAILTAFLVQLAISVALSIASPLLVSLLGLPFDALSVLRLALTGAAFHFLFQASCGVILFVQYERVYLWLQAGFLLLNGGLTWALLVNPDLLGMGYVLASMAIGIAAFAAMRRTLASLNHLTFVTNNPSIRRRSS